jgi:hypothetical protein
MDKPELEAALATLDTFIQVFAVLVAIGIVGEVGFGVRHWVLSRRLQAAQHIEDLERQSETARFNKQASDANKEAGEARKDAAHAIERASRAEENLASANERAALAEQHAADANRTTEGFRLDIARANERAAAANETAERERLARLQLEARLADRVLTPAQQQSIAGTLGPLGIFSFQLFTYSDVTEVTRIGDMIAATLTSAGWNGATAGARGGVTVSGIVITIGGDASVALRNAAALLVSELIRAGVGAILSPEPMERIPGPGMSFGNTIPNPQIRIMIGTK